MMRSETLRRSFTKIGAAGFQFTAQCLSLGQDETSGVENEEVFELSPFEVTSTESFGYEVRDLLAGSRLRTDVKDMGAAVTILSRDFLDDLGASDIDGAGRLPDQH